MRAFVPPDYDGVSVDAVRCVASWTAISADRASYTGRRTGNANQLLYSLFNTRNPSQYFHDITGIHQVPNNNGLFPTTPGYDLSTGIGTAIMAPIITARP